MSATTTLKLGSGWMRSARIFWVVLFVFSVGLFIYAVPQRYTQLKTVSMNPDTRVGELSPVDVSALSQIGISPEFYATYFTALEVFAALPFIVVATILFLRKSEDWVVLLISITGILFGTMSIPVVDSLSGGAPALATIILVLRVAAGVGFVITLFVFPDGRFIPTWSRWLALTWIIFGISMILVPGLEPPPGIASVQVSDIPLLTGILVWIGIGITFQVYRYLYGSSPLERQQTKWVVYGSVLAFVLLLVATLPNIIFETLRDSNILSMQVRFFAVTITLILTIPIIPVTVGFSVLRYRLWDIDLLIQRTLVYGLLTFLLILVYFISILGLQLIFGAISGQDAPIVIVISTLIIAALFNPLRQGVQNFIDRRFYRRKYDAEKALEIFSMKARQELDLDGLNRELIVVVQDTIQPSSIELWIKPKAGNG